MITGKDHQPSAFPRRPKQCRELADCLRPPRHFDLVGAGELGIDGIVDDAHDLLAAIRERRADAPIEFWSSAEVRLMEEEPWLSGSGSLPQLAMRRESRALRTGIAACQTPREQARTRNLRDTRQHGNERGWSRAARWCQFGPAHTSELRKQMASDREAEPIQYKHQNG